MIWYEVWSWVWIVQLKNLCQYWCSWMKFKLMQGIFMESVIRALTNLSLFRSLIVHELLCEGIQREWVEMWANVSCEEFWLNSSTKFEFLFNSDALSSWASSVSKTNWAWKLSQKLYHLIRISTRKRLPWFWNGCEQERFVRRIVASVCLQFR